MNPREIEVIEAFRAQVARLAKPGADILATMTPEKFGALAASLGHLINQTESLDRIKKAVIYNKDNGFKFNPVISADYSHLTPDIAHLLHMTVGAVGEVGELADAISKHVFSQSTLDLENVIEELGDLEFYLEGIRQGLRLRMIDIRLHNLRKLSGKDGRYSDGTYSDAQAQARIDKELGK